MTGSGSGTRTRGSRSTGATSSASTATCRGSRSWSPPCAGAACGSSWTTARGPPGETRTPRPLPALVTDLGTDGVFLDLKGGPERVVTGSEWYADDGVRTPEHTVKLLRTHPAVERSATIGFRCAADLEDS